MGYLTRRLMTFPLIMLGVSILVFVAIRLVPGDAITAMLGTNAGLLTPEQRQALAAYFGIDQSWFVQYWRWLFGVLQGNLGISVTYGKPVLDIILERFPLTLELALLSMVIALLIGLPAGVFAATRNERLSDLAVRIVAMVGQSTPNFVLGLLIIYALSAGWRLADHGSVHAALAGSDRQSRPDDPAGARPSALPSRLRSRVWCARPCSTF